MFLDCKPAQAGWDGEGDGRGEGQLLQPWCNHQPPPPPPHYTLPPHPHPHPHGEPPHPSAHSPYPARGKSQEDHHYDPDYIDYLITFMTPQSWPQPPGPRHLVHPDELREHVECIFDESVGGSKLGKSFRPFACATRLLFVKRRKTPPATHPSPPPTPKKEKKKEEKRPGRN